MLINITLTFKFNEVTLTKAIHFLCMFLCCLSLASYDILLAEKIYTDSLCSMSR